MLWDQEVLYTYPAHAPQDPTSLVVPYIPAHAPQDPTSLKYYTHDIKINHHSIKTSVHFMIISGKKILSIITDHIIMSQKNLMPFMIELYIRVSLNFYRILSTSLCKHDHILSKCKRL